MGKIYCQKKMSMEIVFSSHENLPCNSTACVEIGPIEKRNSTTNETNLVYDIVELLKMKKSPINFNTLLKIELRFKLKSYRLGINHKRRKPECFNVDGKVVFDDSNRDGQMKIDLVTTLQEIECHGEYSSEDEERRERTSETLFDAIVMVVSFISSVLCIRSIIRGLRLRKETARFFEKRFRKKLSWSDQMEFLNLWYVCIVINDILTIIGSSFKIQLDNRVNKNARSSSENYDFCGVMLGTGSLLVWLGVVRYIGFFKTFNILVLVLKKAFPNMMRFLVCTLMLYTGFMLCGWVVLGPYHIKFREISTSSECLYSLINGDDMFVTFSATVTKNPMIWYYSRIFLYLFISLFIYAVLNLFMAVIIDTYETIKEYYEHGFPKSELFEFIDLCEDSPESSIYRREDKTCSLSSCLCWCFKNHPDKPNETTSLLKK
ncbi:hypothetical protein KUTeg_016002 [Tegillarca granosa]|uniref:Polycystin cation channel PKD1/PKD2 domain-containing protein n=1 Tax=Tegillarca granosa TaxID=220873 RepID=A0ABQ9EPC1_TEGGR|nr:hypothetical protein KUTeg_016002 [Tegillarca granosa]